MKRRNYKKEVEALEAQIKALEQEREILYRLLKEGRTVPNIQFVPVPYLAPRCPEPYIPGPIWIGTPEPLQETIITCQNEVKFNE